MGTFLLAVSPEEEVVAKSACVNCPLIAAVRAGACALRMLWGPVGPGVVGV